MPRILVCSLLLLLAACVKPLPAADPGKAWIDLHANAGIQVTAKALDGRDWSEGRYFEVPPGKHALQVRLQFGISGGGSGEGREHSGGGQTRTCILGLDYGHFAAGANYVLKVGTVSRRGWIRLYDEDNRVVARGRTLRCGAF